MLTSVIAVFTVMAVLQLAFALHVRNSLTAFAVEGARHGARSDAAPGDGVQRARYLIDRASAGATVSDVVQTHDIIGGRGVVVVEVRADLPVLGPWGIGSDLTVRGRAVQEGR
ncbi:pilus assembly protein [Kytococcus sp. Marseille-QA3725]